jgi:hypothetical protein
MIRAIFIGLLFIAVAGFGLCGSWGMAVGLYGLNRGHGGGEDFSGAAVVFGGLGLLIALVLGYVLYRLLRRAS